MGTSLSVLQRGAVNKKYPCGKGEEEEVPSQQKSFGSGVLESSLRKGNIELL